jgi:hypothetical protein
VKKVHLLHQDVKLQRRKQLILLVILSCENHISNLNKLTMLDYDEIRPFYFKYNRHPM